MALNTMLRRRSDESRNLTGELRKLRRWLLIGFALVHLCTTAGATAAQPVVTYYPDRASFLAALSSSTVVDFEGIVPDDGFQHFAPFYQVGAVGFASPERTVPVTYQDVAVVGRIGPALGTPFDSAI